MITNAKIGLEKLLFAFYSLLRFNPSIRQLDAKFDVSYRSLRRRVERSGELPDARSLDLVGPGEIDEVYITAGVKGCERDQESRSRGLLKRGRGSYTEDKPPVFTLVDRGSDQQCIVPAKSANESTVRLLLDDHARSR